MFFIAYAFKGQVHVFAGRVKIVSHSSCRTSAIFKYFFPLDMDMHKLRLIFKGINSRMYNDETDQSADTSADQCFCCSYFCGITPDFP